MPQKPDEGFVCVVRNKVYYPALRHYVKGGKTKIAHYPPNASEGKWSKPGIAKTFIKIPWTGVTSQNQARDIYERHVSMAAEKAETDRLCKPIQGVYDVDLYKCVACGSLVWNRGKHLADHQRKNLVDPAFHLTVDLLFGDMAVAEQAQDDAANMLLEVFGSRIE